MHGTTIHRPTSPAAVTGVDAVVWIEPGRAVVVVGSAAGDPETLDLPVPQAAADTPAVLARIAHRIGTADRIVVFGTESLRLALEREIVAIGHRPETIHDESASGRLDEAALIARLRRLA